MLGALVLAYANSSQAQTILAVDFDTAYSGGSARDTQTGFETFLNPGDNTVTTNTYGSFDVTVAGGTSIGVLDLATGNAMNGRYRGSNGTPAIANSGAFTLEDVWSDRLVTNGAASGLADGSGAGLYIRVDGLSANTAYTFKAWGGDPAGGDLNDLDNYGFDATNESTSGLVALGNYTITGDPTTILNDDEYSISGTITTDASGTLIYKSVNLSTNNATTGLATGPNGIINGFTIVAVPEPSSFLLLTVGLVSLVAIRRRK